MAQEENNKPESKNLAYLGRLTKQFLQYIPSRRDRILITTIVLVIATLILWPTSASAAPKYLSVFTQGQIGRTTITLGSVSIHPLSAAITNTAPVCLVFVAVEMQGPAFSVPEGGVFLMGSQRRTYPASSITPLGHDLPFGQRKVRAFGFNPTELCQQGELKIEDLTLLIVHPTGVGVVSFSPVLHADQ